MRRNPTLPTIRQNNAIVNTAKSKQGMQTFRKIQDKVNSHDEQIVKNQKIISNLANQFRMLKEQLQFEQQYNEKHKISMTKYQEQTARHLKMIRDHKQSIAKLQLINKEKEKNLELMRQERQQLKMSIQELNQSLQEVAKQNKKKDALNKQLESQLEKAKKDIKEKQKDIKEKQLQIKRKEEEIREAFISDRQIRQSKIKKLQKDLQLANLYLQNNKQTINLKDKEIHRLGLQIFQFQDKLKHSQKNELKIKAIIDQMKLFQRQNDDLSRKLKDSQQHVKNLEVMIKTQQSKSNTNTNQKMKQLQQQKKELNDKLEKLTKEVQQAKRKIQSEKGERQKTQKKQKQARQHLNKLQMFHQKLNKFKAEINQQLSKLKSNILCDFCSKPMKNPVTNIPCGHSYCQQCKNGYLKECKKCAGVKRQAVYRNELLDQIIAASNLIQKIVILINN